MCKKTNFFKYMFAIFNFVTFLWSVKGVRFVQGGCTHLCCVLYIIQNVNKHLERPADLLPSTGGDVCPSTYQFDLRQDSTKLLARWEWNLVQTFIANTKWCEDHILIFLLTFSCCLFLLWKWQLREAARDAMIHFFSVLINYQYLNQCYRLGVFRIQLLITWNAVLFISIN